MNPPLISVLIPTYNRVTTLEQCVRSAQAGGYDRLEIIISDNASTDGTQELARRLAAEDPRIVFLEHASNLGPLPNWRACLERASGDYVHWLWSDDWIEPNFYRTLVDGMQNNHAAVACCSAMVVDPIINVSYCIGVVHERKHSADDLVSMYWGGPHPPYSPAAYLLPIDTCREHFFSEIPLGPDIDCNSKAMGGDLLMILGSVKNKKSLFICPKPLVNFRHHTGSISVSNTTRVLSAHYTWAKLWWAKKYMPRKKWHIFDYLRLIRRGYFRAAYRAFILKN